MGSSKEERFDSLRELLVSEDWRTRDEADLESGGPLTRRPVSIHLTQALAATILPTLGQTANRLAWSYPQSAPRAA